MTNKSDKKESGRGEIWVLIQLVFLAAIALSPLLLSNVLVWSESLKLPGLIVGVILGISGLLLILWSATNLGSSLTIFPRPKADGTLTQHGVYGIVRHPMYGGVLLAVLGWSLLTANTPALILSVLLGVFFDRKAQREEIWLMQQYPDYASYRQRVRKLIPFLY
ncbi:MAG: isoprenylcysteine carboxylmethyltransferase family protein [Chloroflexota bacterium]